MKHTLITLFLVTAIPCSAQWKNANFGGPVLAFGVHDTSLFISSTDAVGNTGSDVFRLGSLKPNVVWVIDDTGIDFSQGNVTSFASLGKYFFAGMTRNGGPGAGWETTNNGSSWANNGGGFMCSNGTYIFGVGSGSGSDGIYLSKDSGVNWTKVTTFVATSLTASGPNIYAITLSGVWRSEDSGLSGSWSQIHPPFSGTMTPMDSLLFIVGGGKLAKSTDSGTLWTTVTVDSAGVPEQANCLATDGKNLFAGTQRGVLVSTDTGAHWTAKNDSLYNLWGAISPAVTQMIVFDSSLFIEVTYGTGKYYVFDRPIRELIDTTKSGVQAVSSTPNDSIMIYPNPATGMVTIHAGNKFILGVSVLNVLGLDVLDILNTDRSDVMFDVSKLVAGTYFVRIQTADWTILRKITIER